MGSPYVGQLLLVGFNFAPQGWALCNGQILSIAENDTLYNLIGTTYGGDGQQTFGLPDLRGRTPLSQGQLQNGQNYTLGQSGGVEQVTLITAQYAQHSHPLLATQDTGNSNQAQGNLLATPQTGTGNPYINAAPLAAMNPAALLASGGGNQPHENRQPYQVLNWIISLYGVYPPPS